MAIKQIPQLLKPIEPVGNISPEVKSGQGFTFEDYVTAVYLVGLLTETTAPGLDGRAVTRVEMQQGSFGRPLDDLIVSTRRPDGVEATADFQIKARLVISAADTNADFRETIERAYQTLLKAEFKQDVDRVGAVVSSMSDGSRRDFQSLCEMARDEAETVKFVGKLRTPGTAGNKVAQFDAVKTILEPYIDAARVDEAVQLLLAHFVLVRMDMVTEGSVEEAQTIARLPSALPSDERDRAPDLWKHLLGLTRPAQGRSAGLDRRRLVAKLRGAFRLEPAASLQAATMAIRSEADLACSEIPNQIGGVTIAREAVAKEVLNLCSSGQFVQVTGVPGAGKSVVLRTAVEMALERAPTLFLKSDRLTGSSWSQFATGLGIGSVDLEELLVELAAGGNAVLFIDGIDRVEVLERKVLTDIFATIASSDLLDGWTVVATVRDTGIEPVRTWLPDAVVTQGIASVVVREFDDEEAKTLAEAQPGLAASLNSPEPVRSLVRRPFFAAVLARAAQQSQAIPTSEIGLAELWWQGGGYVGDTRNAGARRTALIRLAQEGADQLGRRIPAEGLDQAVLEELAADGVIRWVKFGHRLQFAHDIFFEWAFLQYLVGKDQDWPQAVKQVGQPPALGRVVELLSQSTLMEGGSAWGDQLSSLEGDSELRSQWRRCWLVGPFLLPTLDKHLKAFDDCVLANPGERLVKLLVWFQAEKSQPNRFVLSKPGDDPAKRIRIADLLAIPGNGRDWQRFCSWSLHRLSHVEVAHLRTAFEALDVWQNLWADIDNPLSCRIVEAASKLLNELEDIEDLDGPRDWGKWGALKTDERRALVDDLRRMVLRGAAGAPDFAKSYLLKLAQRRHRADGATEQAFLLSHALVGTCADELVEFSQRALKAKLPDQLQREVNSGAGFRYHQVGDWDWEHLALEDVNGWDHASPSRDPFKSLLTSSPTLGLSLVRDLSNHAVEAWKQLKRLSHDRRAHPIELELTFPWGKQTFWGGEKEYRWSDGVWAPAVLGSALMALASWALHQLDNGTPADDVIKQVLEGHQTNAVLAVASLVALRSGTISSVTAPLISCHRVWRWDVNRAARASINENLFGFNEYERTYAEAVKELNGRTKALGDIRALALRAVVIGGEIGDAVAASIREFESDLPFDSDEERDDAGKQADLARTAQIWAQLGVKENYRAQPLPDGTGYAVVVDNPAAVGHDIDAMNARNAALAETLPLQNWTHGYFEHKRIPASLSVEQAIASAKVLDSPDLFKTGYVGSDAMHYRQGDVAGVAAVALYEQVEDEVEWAVGVCLRALETPEGEREYFIPTSILHNHPVQRAVQGLGAMLRIAGEVDAATLRAILTEFTAHPYVRIGIEALAGMVGAWSAQPAISIQALRLAVDLSIIPVLGGPLGIEKEDDRARVLRIVTAELARLESLQATPASTLELPELPPYWVRALPSDAQKLNLDDTDIDSGEPGVDGVRWVPNSLQVHANFLKDVLPAIPLDEAIGDPDRRDAFLAWSGSLLKWTIERQWPAWANERELRDIRRSPRVVDYKWDQSLCRFVADITLRLDLDESERLFLDTLFGAGDEAFRTFGETYMRRLVCAIADSPDISPVALALAQRVVARLILDEGWADLKRRRGGRGERSFEEMIGDAFFAGFSHADLAVRFANDRWDDVRSVLPVFEPLLAAHGDALSVANSWVRLCEKSFEHYPASHFASNLKHLFPASGGRPGWAGSSVTARLAGLIQRFSERTQPLPPEMAQECLRALDELIDLGDRRAAAVQTSEVFRLIRHTKHSVGADTHRG